MKRLIDWLCAQVFKLAVPFICLSVITFVLLGLTLCYAFCQAGKIGIMPTIAIIVLYFYWYRLTFERV